MKNLKKIITATFTLTCVFVQSFAINQIDGNWEEYGLTSEYDGYYVIATAEDLEEFRELTNYHYGDENNANAVLISDITVNESVLDENGLLREDWETAISKKWLYPMSSMSYNADNSYYSGTFDGRSHTISGLYVTGRYYVGFFGYVDNATIKNLNIEDSFFQAEGAIVGGIVGSVSGTKKVTISNCSVNAYIYSNSEMAGGIYGGYYAGNEAIIENCENKGTVVAQGDYVGGICAQWDGTITNCSNSGAVIGKSAWVGGIVGNFLSYNATIISKCQNTGTISGGERVGGIVGESNSVIRTSCNYGTISGKNNVGGVAGYIYEMENVFNVGSISADNGSVGGLAGYCGWAISYAYNAGQVSNNGYLTNVGGLCGSTSIPIVEGMMAIQLTSCYYDSEVCPFKAVNNAEYNGATAMTTDEMCSSTLLSGFDSDIWTAGNTDVSGDIVQIDDEFATQNKGLYPQLKNSNELPYAKLQYYNTGTHWETYNPIYTIDDLLKMEGSSEVFVLMNDITEFRNLSEGNLLETPVIEWEPINLFEGSLYGRGKTISGLFCKIGIVYGGDVGLFFQVRNALIDGLKIANCRFIGENYVGSITAIASGKTSIINCNNYCDISGYIVGGICGVAQCTNSENYVVFSKCNNYGALNGSSSLGGICGLCSSIDILECTNNGNLRGEHDVGGIIGYGYQVSGRKIIQQCVNNGTISTNTGSAGGIAGRCNAFGGIYDCLNKGDIVCNTGKAGGIIGEEASGDGIDRCLNLGTIQSNAVAGAICAQAGALGGEYSYYNSDTCSFKAVSNKDDGVFYGMTTSELCNGELPRGFEYGPGYWAIRPAEIINMKKYYYYPYLKCYGEESAILAQVKDCHSVSMNFNGGTTTDSIISFYVETEQALLPTNVKKTGCTFDGWYDNSNYTSSPYTEVPLTETQPKNFYAKWIANNYSVSLSPNGGNINMGNVQSYTYGYGAWLPQDVTKAGNTFKGWYPIKTCDVVLKSYLQSQKVATMQAIRNLTDYSLVEIQDIMANLPAVIATQVPISEAINYKTQLNSVSATVSFESAVLSDEEEKCDLYLESCGTHKIDVVKIIRKHLNLGLADAKTLADAAPTTLLSQVPIATAQAMKADLDTLDDVISSYQNFVGGSVVTTIPSTDFGDKYFGAKWQPNTYTITYNTNGGLIETSPIESYTFGENVELPQNITREGYTFEGWYNNSNLTGSEITDITSSDYGDKVFYAKWAAKEYVITFDVNGGLFSSSYPESYIYGTTTLLPTSVSRVGYNFNGWNEKIYYTVKLESFGDSEVNVITAVRDILKCGLVEAKNIVESAPVILPICYIEEKANEIKELLESKGATVSIQKTRDVVNKYVIYLNSDEGNRTAVALAVRDVLGIGLSEASELVKKAPVTIKIVETESEAETIKEILENSGASISVFSTSDYPITSISNTDYGDRYYKASWQIIDYTIKFNFNGGITDEEYATQYNLGSEVIFPVPTREGYEFGGWYNNSNLVGTEFTKVESTETGDKEFWAKWNVNSYTVSFEPNGGTINSGRIKNYVYGTTIVLPYDVTQTGYTFDGWYTDEDCSGEAVLSILSTDLGNKTFYANWIVNSYNVILVTNEGTINSENIENYTYGTGATLPTDVTKTGYTFDGWYTNSSYIGGSVASVLPSETGDKTFYAKWTVDEYKVSADYDKVMGTVTGEDYYEYKSAATLKAIANEGYEFVGWNNNELKDERIQLTVTKDTTLTANFKEKEKVQISGVLEIPTLKTERESAPIDLAGLFTTTEGSEISYSATSSAPNVVAATVNDGKLFLTVYEYEGEAEITVTATLSNGEKNTVKATATVVLACNIQVAETITNVSCYGESDGEIALKVTNAAEPYTTLWTGATATTDTIKDVKAGNYEVVITDNENCTFTKTYTVSQPEEMKLSAKIKHPTCDNADGSITITLTGAENASFAWSNDATTQNAANLAKGDYSLVVTNTETGCQIGDNFTLVEPEAPVVTVSNVVETACNESAGAVTISANEDGLLYNWSNNKHTKNLTNVPVGDYTLSVVNPETNCTATLEVTVPSIKLKQPEIALVTVSEQTGKNLVVWLKENTDLIQRYNIYRESETANVYTKIAEVPYSELSVYEDLEANPAVTAWRYKISATDVCNEETELGEYHKTIHLMQNQGLGGVYNLDWNTYEGLDFPTYVVIRKSVVRKVVTMDTIAYLSSNNNTYTDTLPAKGTQAYYVGMVLPEEINPMTQFMKAESGPFSIALSNIAEVESDEPDAVYDLSGSNAKAYAWGHTIYVKGAESQEVAVYDVKGRKIDAAEGQNDCEFQVRLDGVYFVKVGEYTFKVVVE